MAEKSSNACAEERKESEEIEKWREVCRKMEEKELEEEKKEERSRKRREEKDEEARKVREWMKETEMAVKDLRERVTQLEREKVREAKAEGSTPFVGSTGKREEREEAGRKEERGRTGKQEREEREKRKKNVTVRGIKEGKGGWKAEVRRVLKEALGREAEIDGEWERGDGRGGKMQILVMKDEKEKEEVLRKAREIEEREGVRLDKDRTFEERGMMWRLKEKEREEREKGREVEVEGEKIKVEGQWWEWNKETRGWERAEEMRRRREEEEREEQEKEERRREERRRRLEGEKREIERQLRELERKE